MYDTPARSVPRDCSCGERALVTLHGEPLCAKDALKRLKAEHAAKLAAAALP